MKKWTIQDKQKKDSRKQSIDEIIKTILKNRGLTDKKKIDKFLYPSLNDLMIKSVGLKREELDKTVIRIRKARDNHDSVVVYTDYDADGICAGAIVWETLYDLGLKVMPYVPHREKEGYGLSKIGIDAIAKEFNPQLIITVDHGITSRKEISYAKALGIETIVLDHHLIPQETPKAQALIHTTKLSAGGIAWFLADFLQRKLSGREGSEEELKMHATRNLDLATLATVADLVPLFGANRVIVKFGLEVLNKTERVGLDALIQKSGLRKGEIGVYEVGHILAPRINAAGRLTHALDALRLICTNDKDRASFLADKLSLTNRERQVLSEKSTSQAIEMVRHKFIYSDSSKKSMEKLIFVCHKEFKEGIIGLIAGKLVEEFYRPAIVVSQGENFSKASARSVAGFNIVEAIRKFPGLLEDVGGHPMAAGFTVATKNLDQLKSELQKIAHRELDEDKLIRTLTIDTVLDLSDITKKLYDKLQQLAPYGIGNPEPVFASYQVKIVGASLVGKDRKHLKMKIKDVNSNSVFEAIGFNMGEVFRKVTPHGLVDMAYTIAEDKWNGKNSLQLKLKDLRVNE